MRRLVQIVIGMSAMMCSCQEEPSAVVPDEECDAAPQAAEECDPRETYGPGTAQPKLGPGEYWGLNDLATRQQSQTGNKSLYIQAMPHYDGGMVKLTTSNIYYSTIIINGRRWITDLLDLPPEGFTPDSDYIQMKYNPYAFDGEGDSVRVAYYTYDEALTFDGLTTQRNRNAPAGMVETSAWRLPRHDDDFGLYNDFGWNDCLQARTMKYIETGRRVTKYYQPNPHSQTQDYQIGPRNHYHWNFGHKDEQEATEEHSWSAETWWITICQLPRYDCYIWYGCEDQGKEKRLPVLLVQDVIYPPLSDE